MADLHELKISVPEMPGVEVVLLFTKAELEVIAKAGADMNKWPAFARKRCLDAMRQLERQYGGVN